MKMIEQFTQILKDLGVILLIPCAQSTLGWAKRALSDSEITVFEWKELAVTVVRVGSVTAAAYYGLTFAGLDISVVSAALGGFLFDKFHQAIKY